MTPALNPPNQHQGCADRSTGGGGSTRAACTFFRNAHDNIPRHWAGSWDQLQNGLQRIRRPRSHLKGDVAKKSLPALCAATFLPGATRAREHVVGVQILLLDFDNSMEQPTGEVHPSGRPKTQKVVLDTPVEMEVIQGLLSNAGVAAVAWTTWSAKPEWPKFRVAIPLAFPVPGHLWPQVTEWALGALGLQDVRAGIDIPVLHNPAALAFLPGAPDPSIIRFFSLMGRPLNVPLDQMHRVEVPAQEFPNRQHSGSKARTGERWWKSYQIAPGKYLDFKTLNLIPVLKRLGCRLGPERPWGTGTKMRCTCPWASEHSGGVDDDSAVIFRKPGKWPIFACSHSGHGGLGLKDVIKAAWGG